MRQLLLAALALAAGLAVQAPAFAATPLDETSWTADSNCFIRGIYFYADGDADIDFGDDDFDFGYWYLYDENRVVGIEFEFYYDTFLGIFDGTNIRAVHGYTFEDDNTPHMESCTFYRD